MTRWPRRCQRIRSPQDLLPRPLKPKLKVSRRRASMDRNRAFLKRSLAGIATMLFSCALAAGQEKHLTAREIISRIQAQVGVPWQSETVDTFKAGNPDEPVTGVALTMMATMDVLELAAASGKNLVITHEPTFYNHLDKL